MPMEPLTDYLAPFSLWLCVRRHYRDDGALSVEPAPVSNALNTGPLMFVSRLHAHLYAALCNREQDCDGAHPWECMPLHAFGLREYGRTVGGRLDCELAYGFATDETGALAIAHGAPRVRVAELSFEIGDDMEEPTFSFNQHAFEFMQTEWTGIGAPALLATFDRVDALSDVALARTLDAALLQARVTHTEPEVESGIDYWAVYDPGAARWVGAPGCVLGAVPRHSPTLH